MNRRQNRGDRLLALVGGLAAALALFATPATGAPGKPDDKGEKPEKNAPPQSTDSSGQGPSSGSGIIQAISGRVVLVRELDGRVLQLRVGPKMTVYVDGERSGLGKVKPGFVVTFSGADGTGGELRASDPTPPHSRDTVVKSVAAGSIVVVRPNGSMRSIAVGPSTRILLNGRRVALAALRAGDVLVKAEGKGSGKRPALSLRLRRTG